MTYFNVLAIVLISQSALATPDVLAAECAAPPTSAVTINVRNSGAKGNGLADDTAAIQNAVDQVAGSGGTVLVPAGTYMINAVSGIQLKSNMTMQLAGGATLKVIPNDKVRYNVLRVVGVSNVTLRGGTLIGDRDDHKGAPGQWGMGVSIGSGKNIVVEDMTAKNMWGDGFYVYGASQNVKLCSVTADRNRRQGLSIVSADGLVVQDSVFSNTAGVGPESGIDIEPNEDSTVRNVRIVNSKFLNNKGHGIVAVVTSKMKNAHIESITVEKNSVAKNKKGGIGIYNTAQQRIVDNDVRDNAGFGILLHRTASKNIVTGNHVIGPRAVEDQGANDVLSRNNTK